MKSLGWLLAIVGSVIASYSVAAQERAKAPAPAEHIPAPGSNLENPAQDPMYGAWVFIHAIGSRSPNAGVSIFRGVGFDRETSELLYAYVYQAMDVALEMPSQGWLGICEQANEIRTRAQLEALTEAATMRWRDYIRGSFDGFWKLVDEDGRKRLAQIPSALLDNSGTNRGISLAEIRAGAGIEAEPRPVEVVLANACSRILELRPSAVVPTELGPSEGRWRIARQVANQ